MLLIDERQDGDLPPSRTSVTHATQEMEDLTATSSGAVNPAPVGQHRFLEARHIMGNFLCHSRLENSGSAAVSHESLLRILTHSVAVSLGVGAGRLNDAEWRCRPDSGPLLLAVSYSSFAKRESLSSCCAITSIKKKKAKQNGVYCTGKMRLQGVSAQLNTGPYPIRLHLNS